MAYEWLSPALSFAGGLAGSVVTLGIGLYNFKISKQSLKQQRIINKMNLKNAKIINDQSLKAEVVVKSRIEWIKDVRDMSKRFIALHSKQLTNINLLINYSNEFNRYQTDAFKVTLDADSHSQQLESELDSYEKKSLKVIEKITNLDKEFNNNIIEFNKIQFEFFNYFPAVKVDYTENADNLDIINKLDSCIKSLDNLKLKWEDEIQNNHLSNEVKDYLSGVNEIGQDFRKDINEINKDINNFSDSITNYLKKEWEKVKRIE